MWSCRSSIMVSHTFVFKIAVLNQIMQCGCHKID